MWCSSSFFMQNITRVHSSTSLVFLVRISRKNVLTIFLFHFPWGCTQTIKKTSTHPTHLPDVIRDRAPGFIKTFQLNHRHMGRRIITYGVCSVFWISCSGGQELLHWVLHIDWKDDVLKLGSGFMIYSIAQRGLKLPYMPKRGAVFDTFDLVKVSCSKNIIFFYHLFGDIFHLTVSYWFF